MDEHVVPVNTPRQWGRLLVGLAVLLALDAYFIGAAVTTDHEDAGRRNRLRRAGHRPRAVRRRGLPRRWRRIATVRLLVELRDLSGPGPLAPKGARPAVTPRT